MTPIAISIDGALVAPEHATISVLDRGLLYGDGVFEVLRTSQGRPVDLDGHLDRLEAAVVALQLRAIDRPALVAAVDRTSSALGGGDQRIRIVITRGPGGLGARLATLGTVGGGRLIVIAEPLPVQPSEVSAVVVDWPLARRRGAGHKTLAYLDHVIARELAAAAGADEAIRLDVDGDVVEGATSNVFVVIGGSVATPAADGGVLAGITRGRVLACCGELGIVAAARRISLETLHGADEVFVTSSLRGVVPVTRLDGELRLAGPVTARLAAAYAHAICR